MRRERSPRTVRPAPRQLARPPRFNEDLTEAVALAHDLGRTSFGRAGEEALDELWEELRPRFDEAAGEIAG